MQLANIWRQGQLFVFSALDGVSTVSDDFVGSLSGDRTGIRFYTQKMRELAVVGYQTSQLDYKAVLSDCISAVTDTGAFRMIYYDKHMVIGDLCEGAEVVAFVDGAFQIEKRTVQISEIREATKKMISAKYYAEPVEEICITVQDTEDGEVTALAVSGSKFAYGYGLTKEAAIKKASTGLFVDLDKAEQNKLAFYKKHAIEGEYSQLYCKCISVMKTLLYSPEQMYKHIWSTPDRLPHKYLWIWDSVLNAIGMRHVDGSIAESMILSLFDNQQEDGRIPHMVATYQMTDIIQPPCIAWSAWKVYSVTGNKGFLKTVFENNARFLDWCKKNRTKGEDELYAWYINTTNPYSCRCGESAVDNSPRFDDMENLQAIDLCSYIARDVKTMAQIAEEIGEDPSYYKDYYEELKEKVNKKLWSDGFYYDYDLDRNQINKVKGIASLTPMYAGFCSKEQAAILVESLKNPQEFGTPFPVPSVALNDPTYSIDMWRGPSWLSATYYVIDGLMECGYEDFAKELSIKILNNIKEWYEKEGSLFEFYDAENKIAPNRLERKGPLIEPYNFRIRMQSIRDYGWTASLSLDLILQFM